MEMFSMVEEDLLSFKVGFCLWSCTHALTRALSICALNGFSDNKIFSSDSGKAI